jgi:hypothetical protein
MMGDGAGLTWKSPVTSLVDAHEANPNIGQNCSPRNRSAYLSFPTGWFTPKKICLVFAALAALAVAASAVAQDKPMMNEGMNKPMGDTGMHHKRMKHHRMMHHKRMMKQDKM